MLLTSPVSRLLAIMPRALGAMGSIERIQKFLLSNDFEDKRVVIENGALPHGAVDSETNGELLDSTIISVTNLIMKESKDNDIVVKPVTFTAYQGTTTMIVGPVGCGKTTLLKYLLGEISSSSAAVRVKTPFTAYCSQSPWLQNSSIRENIIGPLEYDEVLYKKVITICALESDLARMPLGEETEVGSKGLKLSGGQKQRIVRLSSQHETSLTFSGFGASLVFSL
jgi:ATP-binding cassette, subfamily C (CFTR/MRP), member 1